MVVYDIATIIGVLALAAVLIAAVGGAIIRAITGSQDPPGAKPTEKPPGPPASP